MPLTLSVSLASATKSPASRVKVKSFDGGYKAIALNGINPVAENWSVETCPLRNAIANTLENTLIGLSADYINAVVIAPIQPLPEIDSSNAHRPRLVCPLQFWDWGRKSESLGFFGIT